MINQITLEQPLLRRRVVAKVSTANGLLEIFHCIDSGRVITRDKIDTKTGVHHPGLIIGVDKFNRKWVAHNHVSNKRPTLDTMENYLDGKSIKLDNRSVIYTPDQIVQRAIAEVQKGKAYNYVSYNCQTFVNVVVRNENVSEAIDNISNGAMLAGALLTIIGMITKNKALITAGASLAGAGGLGKAYSRKFKI